MNNKDINVAQHMVAHCERIERYLNRCENSLEIFMNDELVQDGVTMQLLAMGELTTHFSEEFKAEYPTALTGGISNSLETYVLIAMALLTIK